MITKLPNYYPNGNLLAPIYYYLKKRFSHFSHNFALTWKRLQVGRLMFYFDSLEVNTLIEAVLATLPILIFPFQYPGSNCLNKNGPADDFDPQSNPAVAPADSFSILPGSTFRAWRGFQKLSMYVANYLTKALNKSLFTWNNSSKPTLEAL